jgi:hypothetical protein
MVTGHGLKTVEALAGVVGPTATIAPTLEAFAEVMEGDGESMNGSHAGGAR